MKIESVEEMTPIITYNDGEIELPISIENEKQLPRISR